MIYEVPNFIDGELCNDLIKYHDDSNNVKRKMQHPIFNNRVICPSEIRDPDIAFRMRIFEHKVTQIASKLFYKEPFLFIEHWDVVHWEPGMSMEAHVDIGEFTYDHHDDYEIQHKKHYKKCRKKCKNTKRCKHRKYRRQGDCLHKVWVPHYKWKKKYIPEHEAEDDEYGKVIVSGHYIKYKVERGGHWKTQYVCKL